MPSPIPIPTNLKKLRGTDRPCRTNAKEPAPQKMDQLEPPEWLSDEEKEEWYAVIEGLHFSGIMTVSDINALSMYCRLWAAWKRESEEGLSNTDQEFGNNNKKISTHFRSSSELFKQLLPLMREFGMTPSSRTRINAEVPKQESPIDRMQRESLEARERARKKSA